MPEGTRRGNFIRSGVAAGSGSRASNSGWYPRFSIPVAQPHDDTTPVFISDITGIKAMEFRIRGAASLQSMGRIAKGVAQDFSNVLCAISGYAALLGRPASSAPEAQTSLSAVVRETQRGVAIANHLLDLCHVYVMGRRAWI